MNSETHNGTVGLHRLEYYRLKHTQIYSEVSTALPKLKRFSRDSSFGPSFTLRKSQDPKATPPPSPQQEKLPNPRNHYTLSVK